MSDSELLAEMVERLIGAGRPEKIILFGSRARGEAEPDSDYDFVIVEPSDAPGHRRAARYLRALRSYDQPIDLLVYTPEEIERWAEAPGSFVMTALRDGRVLYERSD